MNLLSGLIAQLLHIVLMATAAPTLIGLTGWLQARLAGRHGPPVLQPWRDLAKLLRKQTVMAESASGLTEWAPFVCAAAVAIAACLVPSFAWGMTLAPHLFPELNVQLLASIPNGLWIEDMGLADDLWADPVPVVNGVITAPERPGHGLAFKPEILRDCAVGK